MLGIIVIPGDTIIIEEGEKFALVLLKTLFVVHCSFTLILTREKIVVETPNANLLFSQILRCQSEPVHGLNNGLQEEGKIVYEIPQFSIEGLLEPDFDTG